MSDFIFHSIQTSADVKQTVDAKYAFETFANSYGISTKHYHANNRIFNSQMFKKSCVVAQQTQSFVALMPITKIALQNGRLELSCY